jgi:hypothetical protein
MKGTTIKIPTTPIVALLTVIILTLPGAAGAAFIATIPGNDCAGVFGTPPDCTIPGDTFEGIDTTPLIIKFDFDDSGNITATTFGVFLSIDGSEFSFDFGDDGNTGTGTWTYTPGAGDPIITAFVAKGGPNFNLFSNPDGSITGEFFTPTNPQNGEPFGLSHISFYDTPEPATLLLFGAGLLGFGFARQKKTV